MAERLRVMRLSETEQDRHEYSPFAIPDDEELFKSIAFQSASRSKRDELDRSGSDEKGKRHARSTFASRMQATASMPVGHLEYPISCSQDAQTAIRGEANASRTETMLGRRRSETVAEFLSKKREIFLVQMSLDTKRAEICKLEQRSLQRENALKRSEEMIEEDAIKFDAFLKENDEKVQQALKNAEAETRKKQEKIAKIKRLQAEMTAIRTEVNKYEEQLEDFQQYKKFLESVTPAEWFEEQAQKRKALREERISQWKRQCDAVKKRKADLLATKAKAEDDLRNARTQQEAERAEAKLTEAVENVKASKLLKEPPKPSENAETSEDDEEESYFKKPQQLLDLFAGLEEQNLFLIQHVQEIEEGLDRNRAKLTESRERTDREIETLTNQIKSLEGQVESRRRRLRRVRDPSSIEVATFSCNDIAVNAAPVSFEDLRDQLSEVHQRCGFAQDNSVLSMLSSVEMKLEELLTKTKTLHKEFVDASERGSEKKRRQKFRAEKQEQQKKDHEARVKRALERAEAPVFRKTGKPEMFRSVLVKKKKDVCIKEKSDENDELTQFLTNTEFQQT